MTPTEYVTGEAQLVPFEWNVRVENIIFDRCSVDHIFAYLPGIIQSPQLFLLLQTLRVIQEGFTCSSEHFFIAPKELSENASIRAPHRIRITHKIATWLSRV